MILYDILFKHQKDMPRLVKAIDWADRKEDLDIEDTMGTLEWADSKTWVISGPSDPAGCDWSREK